MARTYSEEERRAIGDRIRQFWANMTPEERAVRKAKMREAWKRDTGAAYRFRAYVNNPETGGAELIEQRAATDHELLLAIIDLMYSGQVYYELSITRL